MQTGNWDDYRIFLAVARRGTYAAAARALGIDDTTVARRVARLDRAAPQPLLRRTADGRLVATAAGAVLARRAEAMEEAAEQTAAAPAPVVRVTAVPLLVNRILAPALPALVAAAPGLTLELAGDSKELSLTRREADIALRLGRPVGGGSRVLVRRLATMAQTVCCAAGLDDAQALQRGWITYDDGLSHLPVARWLAAQARQDGAAPLRVGDAETALQAAAAGLGLAVLPAAIVAGHPGLRAVSGMAPPARDLWLMAHRVLRHQPQVVATLAWIDSLGWAGQPL